MRCVLWRGALTKTRESGDSDFLIRVYTCLRSSWLIASFNARHEVVHWENRKHHMMGKIANNRSLKRKVLWIAICLHNLLFFLKVCGNSWLWYYTSIFSLFWFWQCFERCVLLNECLNRSELCETDLRVDVCVCFLTPSDINTDNSVTTFMSYLRDTYLY